MFLTEKNWRKIVGDVESKRRRRFRLANGHAIGIIVALAPFSTSTSAVSEDAVDTPGVVGGATYFGRKAKIA